MRHYIRHLLLTLFVATAAFIATAQQPTTALELNNIMADITDSLYEGGSKWGAAFSEAYKSGRYELLKPHRESMWQFINKKLDYVNTMKDINNSKPLRLAVIEFLLYEKQLLKEAFLPFESLKPGVSQEEVNKLIDKLSTLASKEKDMTAKVNEAQEQYASENGFVLN